MVWNATGVLALVEMIRLEVHSGLQDGGLNRHDTPKGRLEQLKPTGCGAPRKLTAPTVVVAEPPEVIVLRLELRDSKKP